MSFWQEVDAQLYRIQRECPDTYDKVREILLDPQYSVVAFNRDLNGVRGFGPDSAFFVGGGGDRSLWSALRVAGWVKVWSDAYYFYVAQHTVTGELLTYIEGDVVRGDAR